jgi:hypothetical protein
LFRNDRKEDCSTKELIDWDAAIIAGIAHLNENYGGRKFLPFDLPQSACHDALLTASSGTRTMPTSGVAWQTRICSWSRG